MIDTSGLNHALSVCKSSATAVVHFTRAHDPSFHQHAESAPACSDATPFAAYLSRHGVHAMPAGFIHADERHVSHPAGRAVSIIQDLAMSASRAGVSRLVGAAVDIYPP
jgi:hypothetical protein